MALDTVQDYVNAARILLQDQVAPYRYPDGDLVLGLNEGFLEARRLRPDLFTLATPTLPTLPTFTAPPDSTAVTMDPQYRVAFTFYVVGWATLRDEEFTQDARAGAFMGKFKSIMTGLDS